MAVTLQNAPPTALRVHSLAPRKIVSCSSQWGIPQALELMEKEKVRRLAVVDTDGKLAGMLSLADIASGGCFGKKKGYIKPTDFVDTFRIIAKPHSHPSHELMTPEPA